MAKMQRSGAASGRPSVVTDAGQFRALRSPVRQEIVDAMESAGAVTIAEVARRLGRRADALYFHFRALESCGLVAREGARGRGRARAALFTLPRRRLALSYAGAPAARQRRVGPVVDSLLRLARRDVRRALGRKDASAQGPARDLWVARARGNLTPAQVGRVNALLRRALSLVREAPGGEGSRPVSLVFALTPTGGV